VSEAKRSNPLSPFSSLLRISPLAFLLLSLSCASRSLTITSNPTGAEVYLDREYVGLTPVTIPFQHGGEREILLFRPRREGETRSWRPHRMIVDTTKDAFDVPVIDLVTEIAGSKDEQTVDVMMTESNLRELYRIDQDAWRAAVRARADTLRSRAREFQLGALPSSQGRDPGPLESRPESRPEPPKPIDR
jgi:hypothetical protein